MLIPVICPALFTSATLGRDELHVILLSEVLAGEIFGKICKTSPIKIDEFVLSSVIEAAGTVLDTVTVHLADTPFKAVAVTVAVPEDKPVIRPELSICATLGFDDSHVNALLEALAGITVALIYNDSFIISCRLVTFKATMLTWVAVGATVTAHLAVKPFDVVAVTVAVP